MRRHKDVSYRFVLLAYKLQRLDDVSAWFGTFRLVTKICQFLLSTKQYIFAASHLANGSVSFRYQLVRCCNVSRTSVSFRCQLWHFCDVFSCSVSLRYKFVRRYHVSYWLVLFTYQWNVEKASQIGSSDWRTGCDVVMTSRHGPRSPNLLRPKWDVAKTSHAGWARSESM